MNPWSAVNWNLTAQGAYIKSHGMAKAQAQAIAAGTSVGGPKPADPLEHLRAKPRTYILHKTIRQDLYYPATLEGDGPPDETSGTP